ncbi:universal stress protein [Azospirillum picis]|uniref:Nucleotide-binding universal stress UspA family protein n=1 Tax=Azospirillum picis TaxID=488438 RepID=A0ABU0MGC7_9PROT|nr:universal stress protein [Azospirillum picis]MBP2298456.1 nucleotide-binding universal stress UspA family protein [Azospirillum picis]MDQ0532495.1 nucleotide-binding universal stress UspA family protein [Azospirillum picis]
MPIKTILLHMANDDAHASRLAVAAALAKRFSAHLHALYIATPVSMPAGATGRAASYGFMAEATAIAHENAEKIEREVRQALEGLPYDWEVEEGDHVDLLAERASYADLVVVAQSAAVRAGERVSLHHIPDRLPLETATPVLVLPPTQSATAPIGRYALIAWKNSRESARAVRAAMPFLQTAESVTVLTVDPPGQHSHHAAALADWLHRHGIPARPQSVLATGNDAGDMILSCCADQGADLLVMGAYGHSRLRELVLGGATRKVLEDLTLPALMAH